MRAFLSALISALLIAGCSRKDLPFEPPPLNSGESALIALVFDDAIEVYAHDATATLAIGRNITDRAVHLEAAILSQPLKELGLMSGAIEPKASPARSVLDLNPHRFFSADVGDAVSPWMMKDAPTPRFGAFPVLSEPRNCLSLDMQAEIMIAVDDPTFALLADMGSILVGLKNGDLFRVTRSGYTHVEHSSIPRIERVIERAGVYWIGDDLGTLWRGTLSGNRIDATPVATASSAGALRWLDADSSTVAALGSEGVVVEFEGGTSTILGRLPHSELDPGLAYWGGIVLTSDHKVIAVQGTTRRAAVFDHGVRSDEELPIQGTGFSGTMWGGTTLFRDETTASTYSGSSGQVLIRDDGTQTWKPLIYNGTASYITTAVIPHGDGFFAGDTASRVWQYSAETKAYCQELVVGDYDIAALLVQGDSLVVISGAGSTLMGTTRVTWLSLSAPGM